MEDETGILVAPGIDLLPLHRLEYRVFVKGVALANLPGGNQSP